MKLAKTIIRSLLVLVAVLAAGAVARPAAAAAMPSGVDSRVLTELRAEGTVEALVEVRFTPGSEATEHEALETRAAGIQVLERYGNLPLALVRFSTEAALAGVAAAPEVVAIRPNAELRPSLAESLPLVRQPQAVATGNTGAGTYVAVLDTGLDYRSYPSYFGNCPAPGAAGCRVAQAFDAAPEDGALDDDGHGTHVSSIVASVAPGTRIIAIDVFHAERDAQGRTVRRAYTSDVARAIDWVVAQRRAGLNISAMNLSLGGGSHTSACTDDYGFAAARAAGILPVVASGNGAYTQPGRAGIFTDGIASPACIPGAIAVGSVYDAAFGTYEGSCNDPGTAVDKVSCFSQSGSLLSLLAPGARITAAGGTESGTSMAAPHVAGAVAILASAKRSATATQLEQALVSTGPAITDSRNGVVRHRLDIYAALSSLGAVQQPQPTPQPKPVPSPRPIQPTVNAPAQSIAYMANVGSTTVPVDVAVSGRAGRSGARITAFFLYVSRDGGGWQALATRTRGISRRGLDAAAQLRVALEPGHRYAFTSRARDSAGNLSSTSFGTPFTLDAQEDRSSAISWSPGWIDQETGLARGRSLRYATAANATATFTFSGNAVAWVAATRAGLGQARVYVDGAYRMTVDLGPRYGTTPRRIVFAQAFSTGGAHTLQVQAVGTAGRSRVDVDAFLVLR